ncbi:hypothetical protein ACFU5O_00845 [Streptomyces sp. NPDC057445]|uniref:hypothetical protein n=1 Tax=Streptomyces sp. NPDC057445 TaxID=3346136 RepID=UPI00367EE557
MTRPEQSVRDGQPTPWDYLVFLARMNTTTHRQAVDHLYETYGETYVEQSVGNVLKKIRKWYGNKPLFQTGSERPTLTETGRLCHQHAERVKSLYEHIREERDNAKPLLPRLAHLPHHLHYVARLESWLRNKYGPEKMLETIPLRQQHRGDNEFKQHALLPLRHGEYQAVIGRRAPEDMDGLRSERLYWAQLQAKVKAGYAGDTMQLTELSKYPLMVAPRDLGSRLLLEQKVEQYGIGPLIIAEESYETSTHILRMRADHQAGVLNDRVVVVPSDVALVFKTDYEFGGTGAEHFKWVPIMHNAEQLQLEVCVTTLNQRSELLTEAVTQLQYICRKLPGLEGEQRGRGRGPARRPVPGPRQDSRRPAGN